MQSKRMSLTETIISTVVGFALSWLILWFMSAAFHWHTTPAKNTLGVAIFTVASLLRGYFIRRLFNWLGAKEVKGSAEISARIADEAIMTVPINLASTESEETRLIKATLDRTNLPPLSNTGREPSGK